MFLRGGLEYDGGRAVSALALVVLAPFAAGAVGRLVAPAQAAPLLTWLTGVHAATPLVAFGLGVVGLFLLARAYGEWGIKPPLALLAPGALVALVGLVGVLVTRAEPVGATTGWAVGLVGAAALGAAVWRLASVREEPPA